MNFLSLPPVPSGVGIIFKVISIKKAWELLIMLLLPGIAKHPQHRGLNNSPRPILI